MAASRERAQALVLAGKVLVNDQKLEKAGAQVASEAAIRLLGEDLKYASRGGLKLERAVEHWQLNVDIFGVKDVSAELEMITLVNEVFKAFGASSKIQAIPRMMPGTSNGNRITVKAVVRNGMSGRSTSHASVKAIAKVNVTEPSVKTIVFKRVMSTPSAATVSRCVAPARISIPSRVRAMRK